MLWMMAAQAADDAEIREHLLEVVATLRSETPSGLDAGKRARRLSALEALESYAWAGDFPQGGVGRAQPRVVEPPRTFRSALDGERVPRFVDDAGTHCAVGYLMALEEPALVERIRQEHELDWLFAIDTPGVHTWAREHGFTLEELAWIQPTYEVLLGECSLEPPSRYSLEWIPTGCGISYSYVVSCAVACGGPIEVQVAARNPSDSPRSFEVQQLFDDETLVRSQVVELAPDTTSWTPPMTLSESEWSASSIRVVDGACTVDVGSLNPDGWNDPTYESCETRGCSTHGPFASVSFGGPLWRR